MFQSNTLDICLQHLVLELSIGQLQSNISVIVIHYTVSFKTQLQSNTLSSLHQGLVLE